MPDPLAGGGAQRVKAPRPPARGPATSVCQARGSARGWRQHGAGAGPAGGASTGASLMSSSVPANRRAQALQPAWMRGVSGEARGLFPLPLPPAQEQADPSAVQAQSLRGDAGSRGGPQSRSCSHTEGEGAPRLHRQLNPRLFLETNWKMSLSRCSAHSEPRTRATRCRRQLNYAAHRLIKMLMCKQRGVPGEPRGQGRLPGAAWLWSPLPSPAGGHRLPSQGLGPRGPCSSPGWGEEGPSRLHGGRALPAPASPGAGARCQRGARGK